MTKTDLAPLPDFVEEYRKLGVEILTSSSKAETHEEDLERVRKVLLGKTSVLVGHSGVGKSTLINALVPDADRLTGDVNEATGRGRHTSSSAVALALDTHDGWIIDTPGIRAFGLSHIDVSRIVDAFTDLSLVAATCLSNCSHAESSCKLDAWAAPNGVVDPERAARLSSLRSLLSVKDQAVFVPED